MIQSSYQTNYIPNQTSHECLDNEKNIEIVINCAWKHLVNKNVDKKTFTKEVLNYEILFYQFRSYILSRASNISNYRIGKLFDSHNTRKNVIIVSDVIWAIKIAYGINIKIVSEEDTITHVAPLLQPPKNQTTQSQDITTTSFMSFLPPSTLFSAASTSSSESSLLMPTVVVHKQTLVPIPTNHSNMNEKTREFNRLICFTALNDNGYFQNYDDSRLHQIKASKQSKSKSEMSLLWYKYWQTPQSYDPKHKFHFEFLHDELPNTMHYPVYVQSHFKRPDLIQQNNHKPYLSENDNNNKKNERLGKNNNNNKSKPMTSFYESLTPNELCNYSLIMTNNILEDILQEHLNTNKENINTQNLKNILDEKFKLCSSSNETPKRQRILL